MKKQILIGLISVSSILIGNAQWTGTSNLEDNLWRNGNVGIGTINPQERLHIAGNLLLQNLQGSPSSYLYVYSSDGSNNTRIDYNGIVTQGSGLTIRATTKLILNDLGGNVGIGTTNPQNLLDVNGTIHAREVKVDLNFPADYVFKSDYKLMTLAEVERFVKINCHLPEIPSAAEIKENGLNMGEMQNKLLQKIEEMTLYMIEQNKNSEKQNAKIKALEEKIEKLESASK